MKLIPGFDGHYSITRGGQVWSHTREKFIGQKVGKRGYTIVCLSLHNKYHYRTVHRLLAVAFLGATEKDHVDHINRIKTDNRLENLRLCTVRLNLANTGMRKANVSGFIGVSFDKWTADSKKWRVNALRKYVGRFATAEEGARAYDAIVRAAHGEFAFTNF